MKRRLLLVVVASVALVLAALTVGFDLVVSGRLDADAGDLARSRATAALATVRVSGGHVRLDEAASKELAVIDGSGPFGPAGRPMGGYLSLPAAWRASPGLAAGWVERALSHVSTLPPKARKPKRAS